MNERTKALLRTAALSASVAAVLVGLLIANGRITTAVQSLMLFLWVGVVFFVGFAFLLGVFRR